MKIKIYFFTGILIGSIFGFFPTLMFVATVSLLKFLMSEKFSKLFSKETSDPKFATA